MAVQDFLNGGYYGKLGVTVGQRWKNIRTIRSYVIPHNPQTELQQGNRKRFGQALSIASSALAYNKNAPCWQVENMTEFNKRVQVAKTRLDNGVTGWLVLPLYPDGTTPTLTITDITISAGTGNKKILSSAQLATLTENRSFTFSLNVIDTETEEEMTYYFSTQTTAGSATLAEIEIESRYIFPDPTTIIGISNDDAEHNGEIIYIAPQDVTLPSTLVLDDITAEYYSNTEILLKSAKSSLLSQTYNIAYSLQVQNVVTQSTETINGTVTSEIGADYFAKITLPSRYALFTQNTLQATATASTGAGIELEIPDTNIELGQRTIDFATNTATSIIAAPGRTTATYTYTLDTELAGLVLKGKRTAYISTFAGTQETANIDGTLGTVTNSGTYTFTVTSDNGISAHNDNDCTFQNVTDNSEWILFNLPQNVKVSDSTQIFINISFVDYAISDEYPSYIFKFEKDGQDFTVPTDLVGGCQAWIPYDDDYGYSDMVYDHIDPSTGYPVFTTSDYGLWAKDDKPLVFVDSDWETAATIYDYEIVHTPSSKALIMYDMCLVEGYDFQFSDDKSIVTTEDTKIVELVYNGTPNFETVEPAATSGTISYYNAQAGSWTDYTVTNYTVEDTGSSFVFEFPSLSFNFQDGDYVILKNVPIHLVNDYIDASGFSFNSSTIAQS